MEDDRDLRRLAKRNNIVFMSPSTLLQASSTLQARFDAIRKISGVQFATYAASIDIRTNKEPWREGIKSRAQALAARAAKLLDQQRNESGWRFGLENDILRRFTVEVACPNCRARIWRSEYEANPIEPDELTKELNDRRSKRKPCDCPPSDRQNDYYEIGTSPLFDDRAEEFFFHDALVAPHVPKQAPDRVYGLQCTNNFNRLLHESASDPVWARDTKINGHLIRSSPFRKQDEPLLFPFLVVEAKSESSSNGFSDIQAQSAFPIATLLKLQENLRTQSDKKSAGEAPLVWFLGYQGDAWRLYGCFVSDDAKPKYIIAQLWDGSILKNDGALQLLLIVDYIFDWARDIYRPSILRHLKAIASGKTYDTVSIAKDSDIMSTQTLRQHVSEWIPALPNNIEVDDDDSEDSLSNASHGGILTVNVPDMRLGTIRPAYIVQNFTFGLILNERSVDTLLSVVGHGDSKPHLGQKVARDIFRFMRRWDEILIIESQHLKAMELSWTGERPNETEELDASTEQYCFMGEFSTFMDGDWNIVRQLTYVAVSKSAFNKLERIARYKSTQSGLEALPSKYRTCDRRTLLTGTQCLQSGSVEQVFRAALSCTLLSLYAMPETTESDFVPSTETLGFHKIRRPRVLPLVRKYQVITDRSTPYEDLRCINDVFGDRDAGDTMRPIGFLGIPREAAFIHASSDSIMISNDKAHETTRCDRCSHVYGTSGTHPHYMTLHTGYMFSAHGMNLVTASVGMVKRSFSFQIACLFVNKVSLEIENGVAMATGIQNLTRNGSVYHTIRHPFQKGFEDSQIMHGDCLWNLPNVYRPFTATDRSLLWGWRDESLGLLSIKSINEVYRIVEAHEESQWDHTQLLFHFLVQGQSYETASSSAKRIQDEELERYPFREMKDGLKSRRAIYEAMEEDQNADEVPVTNVNDPSLPFESSTRGARDEDFETE